MTEDTSMPLSSVVDQANDYAQRLIEAKNAYVNSIPAAVEKLGDLLIALQGDGVQGTPEGIRGGLAVAALGFAIDNSVVDADQIREDAAERVDARMAAYRGARAPYQYMAGPEPTEEGTR